MQQAFRLEQLFDSPQRPATGSTNKIARLETYKTLKHDSPYKIKPIFPDYLNSDQSVTFKQDVVKYTLKPFNSLRHLTN